MPDGSDFPELPAVKQEQEPDLYKIEPDIPDPNILPEPVEPYSGSNLPEPVEPDLPNNSGPKLPDPVELEFTTPRRKNEVIPKKNIKNPPIVPDLPEPVEPNLSDPNNLNLPEP